MKNGIIRIHNNKGKGMIDHNESPVTHAHTLWRDFVSKSTRKDLNSKSQFGTPPKVAKYMASMIPTDLRSVNLLDAGAGTGILTAAVGEELIKSSKIEELNVDLYEIDQELTKRLRDSMNYLKEWLSEKGVACNVRIIEKDFIIENKHFFNLIRSRTDTSNENHLPSSPYTSAIMNPPYSKIRKSDERAIIASSIVHGQPNIYALFLMLASLMVEDSGTLVSISPRSFTSGLYFSEFRKHFFNIMHPVSIHLFSSRIRAFKSEGILQETIIMQAKKTQGLEKTIISSSIEAKDIEQSGKISVRTTDILRESDGKILFIPISHSDIEVMRAVEDWPESFSSLGYRISTGPVVPFRATEYLVDKPKETKCVPLLWMKNVRNMKINWPIKESKPGKTGKPQYITDSSSSRKLLRPSLPYVLLHRFSSKEQTRRFTVACFKPEEFPFERIGIENHLNYIHRREDHMDIRECLSLAAILSTKLLDAYIRIRSGSTQINATDMEFLPLPRKDKILDIGKKLENTKMINRKDLELLVLKELNLEDLANKHALL